MELNRTLQQDAAQEPSCSCYPVQTFSAGSSCKVLTKNAVFRSPAGEGSTLVCAGDESTNSTMVSHLASVCVCVCVHTYTRVSNDLNSVYHLCTEWWALAIIIVL